MARHHRIATIEGRSETLKGKRTLTFSVCHHEYDSSMHKLGREFLYAICVVDGGNNTKGVYFQNRESLKEVIDALQKLYDEGPDKIEALQYQKAVQNG